MKIGRFTTWYRLWITCAAVCLLGATGCNLCCGPYDYDYPVYGGPIERMDPARGRVGSIFSDPTVVKGPSADSNLKPHDEKREVPENGGFLEAPNSDDQLPNPDQQNGDNRVDTVSHQWRGRPLPKDQSLR